MTSVACCILLKHPRKLYAYGFHKPPTALYKASWGLHAQCCSGSVQCPVLCWAPAWNSCFTTCATKPRALPCLPDTPGRRSYEPEAMLWHVQVCHSVMDQMFHGPEPPQSPAAANDELAKIWSKYSSFPGSGFNPHLRSDAGCTDKMLVLVMLLVLVPDPPHSYGS